MKTSDLRENSLQELKELGTESRQALFDLRFKHYTGQLVDTAALKKARKDVARVETVIRERELAQTAAK